MSSPNHLIAYCSVYTCDIAIGELNIILMYPSEDRDLKTIYQWLRVKTLDCFTILYCEKREITCIIRNELSRKPLEKTHHQTYKCVSLVHNEPILLDIPRKRPSYKAHFGIISDCKG